MRLLLHCLLLWQLSVHGTPRWSWDTIQTFHHCSNTTGPFSPAALEAFANDSFVVIEKVNALPHLSAPEPISFSLS